MQTFEQNEQQNTSVATETNQETTQETTTFDAVDSATDIVEMFNAEVAPYEADRRVYHFAKRVMDIVLSLTMLFFLWPVIAIMAIAVKLDSRGNVFFRHQRVGLHEKPIAIHKFRTMDKNADTMFQNFSSEQKQEFEANYKLRNDPRITKVGKFLRATSMDELPQLIDILSGDLSLVGPRPLVEKELDKYGFQKRRLLSVKPGLTGHWQVSGRSNTSYDKRINLELYYVQNASIWLDIKILLKTIPVVFGRIGAR
ncbi:MAG: sugar transferase [Defluviitaleaceae bacterium]|nr:sugar transferase [Defluviitaleaceae bacterium]